MENLLVYGYDATECRHYSWAVDVDLTGINTAEEKVKAIENAIIEQLYEGRRNRLNLTHVSKL